MARELVAPWALRAVTKPVAAALFTWLGASQWPLVVGPALLWLSRRSRSSEIYVRASVDHMGEAELLG